MFEGHSDGELRENRDQALVRAEHEYAGTMQEAEWRQWAQDLQTELNRRALVRRANIVRRDPEMRRARIRNGVLAAIARQG